MSRDESLRLLSEAIIIKNSINVRKQTIRIIDDKLHQLKYLSLNKICMMFRVQAAYFYPLYG